MWIKQYGATKFFYSFGKLKLSYLLDLTNWKREIKKFIKRKIRAIITIDLASTT